MLGRLKQYDPRNDNFPMQAHLENIPVEPKVWPSWDMFYRPLDQGFTGTCVGHGTKHYMLTTPIIQTKPYAYPTAIDLYIEACKRDPWPENDNGDLQFGTSVLAMFQVLKSQGYVKEYVHTRNVDEARLWLKTKGPLVIGIDWYASMMQTTDEGRIKVDFNSPIVGGHCVCVKYWSKKYDAPVITQSWGNAFGALMKDGSRSGYGFMDPNDFNRLINQDGDCIAALEVRL